MKSEKEASSDIGKVLSVELGFSQMHRVSVRVGVRALALNLAQASNLRTSMLPIYLAAKNVYSKYNEREKMKTSTHHQRTQGS
jgi:hypothetical protein